MGKSEFLPAPPLPPPPPLALPSSISCLQMSCVCVCVCGGQVECEQKKVDEDGEVDDAA